MANNQKGNQKGWDKVVAWYASNAYAVNIIYSLGAAVVIIGALFKIMHWPGAGYILTIGMCTESFLFTLGIFEKPHAVYNWENYFPKLIGHEEAPFAELLVGAANAPQNNGVPALEEKDVKALKDSIANVASTANSLAELGKLAEGSNKLSEKLQAAAAAADKFAGSQAYVAENVEKLGVSYDKAAAAAEKLQANSEAAAQVSANVKANLAAVNAAYEISLKAAQTGAAEAEKLAQIQAQAVEAGKAYAAAQEQLQKQVADLNKVYGNMLSALA